MKKFLIYSLMSLCFLTYISCEDKDNKSSGVEHDPNKPVTLTSFYPDSGRIAEKVMLDGSNFGSDPTKIKVYFNNKPAKVIGSTGSRMYAVVPKMPGDTCTVSVAIGNDSVIYSQKFKYKISVTVSTVVGNGSSTYKLGNLSEATFECYRLCVDDEDNIFTFSNFNNGPVLKVNEKENSVIQLATNAQTGWAASPCVLKGGVVAFPSDNIINVFWTLDPAEGWSLRTKYMNINSGPVPMPGNPWKKATAYCDYDGKIYTLFQNGQLMKINPKTMETDIVTRLMWAESYGLTFHPINKKHLYFSYDHTGGQFANSICYIDVTEAEPTIIKVTGPTGGGHRDGEASISQFRGPQQIFFDGDGNLYVADTENHCIRKITTEGMVETVVGIPGTAGWKDGGKDEALFNRPIGIGVAKDGTVYVGDYNNRRIRKLAIE